MSYATVRYTGNGAQTTFPVPFSVRSLTDLTIYVNGVATTTGFTKTASLVTFAVAPVNGALVRLSRSTNRSARLVDYVDGAVLTEAALDSDSIQAFMMAQEALDYQDEALVRDEDGHFKATAKRIKNLADPIDPQDAVTRAWALSAPGTDIAAANTARIASEAARDAALGSQTAASTSASDAAGSATAALASKNAAATSESNAAGSATAANTSKVNAGTSESNAAGSASAAAGSATAANTSKVNAGTSESNAAGSATAAAGSATAAAGSATAAANSAVSMGNPFKNRIVNPSGIIRQYLASSAIAVTSAFTSDVCDLWTVNTGGTTFALSAFTQASTDTQGDNNEMVLQTTTIKSTLVTSDYAMLFQKIEGLNLRDLRWGTTAAKQVTISGRIRSTVVGKYSICVRNAASNRSYIGEVNVTQANTNQSWSITVPGDTTGTWTYTNNTCLLVALCVGAGPTLQAAPNVWQAGNFICTNSSPVNLMATNGAAVAIKDVQFEVGAGTAYQPRDFATEMNLCLRYWEQSYDYGVPSGSLVAGGAIVSLTVTGGVYCPIPLKQVKRAAPTVVCFSSATGASGQWRDLTAGVDRPANPSQVGTMNGCVSSGGTAAGNLMVGHWIADARMS